jgi:hypothetical protein
MEKLNQLINQLYSKLNIYTIFDHTFLDKYEYLDDIYIILIEDNIDKKKDMFFIIDQLNNYICHISIKLILINNINYRGYIYTKNNILFTDYKIPEIEFIHSIKFRDYFTLDRLIDTNVIYCKTDYLYQLKHFLQSSDINDIVLITGSSDYPIDTNKYNLLCDNISYWYGTNIFYQSENVKGIPIGLGSYDPRTYDNSFLFKFNDNTENHKIGANTKIIIDNYNFPKTFKHNIYMNFSLNTYPDRKRIWDEFINSNNVVSDIPSWNIDKRKHFLNQIYNSQYILCPRGNGLDTHRLWETLYLGSTPIVQKEYGLSFFNDLPILFVDHINKSIIPNLQTDSINKNYHKLYVSYWIEQIEKSSTKI